MVQDFHADTNLFKTLSDETYKNINYLNIEINSKENKKYMRKELYNLKRESNNERKI